MFHDEKKYFYFQILILLKNYILGSCLAYPYGTIKTLKLYVYISLACGNLQGK